jgi:hypothetical protein
MFDQLGGLETLVRGKTVAIKLNMTGLPTTRFRYLPAEMTHWVHPQVIWALTSLLDKAGAQRIRLLESAWSTSEPLEEFMISSGWQPDQFLNAARRVEFENTNFLGKAKSYSRVMVPGGGLMCKGYDLNHSYEDCDVFISRWPWPIPFRVPNSTEERSADCGCECTQRGWLSRVSRCGRPGGSTACASGYH